MLRLLVLCTALAVNTLALPVHLAGATDIASYSFESYLANYAKVVLICEPRTEPAIELHCCIQAYAAAELPEHRAIYDAKVAQILSHNADPNATYAN